MSRLFLLIAICFPTIYCSSSHADEAPEHAASAAYSAAFLRGADNACKQPERATKRYANLLQASCVATDMSAGKDPVDIYQKCFGAPQRGTFVRVAAEICGKSKT